jgi:16S rRNA G966 N2-methylase RsmD
MQFDYIYVAPPQYHGFWRKAVELIDNFPTWMVSDGWVIAQIDPKEYEALTLENFSEFDRRKYGSTLLIFFERKIVNDG